MASDKTEKVLTNTSKISSALTSSRRSILIQDAPLHVLSEKDEAEERLARRNEVSAATKSIATIPANDRRRSLGLSFLAQMTAPEMASRMRDCIKLSQENKINVRNAFNVPIIDFMTYMIKKQDKEMSSLQIASVSLDVSTKIYGCRVDSIHTEMMKFAGVLEKQDDEPATNHNQADDSTVQENTTKDRENRKKKKRKQKAFSTVESLKGITETMKPTLCIMKNEDSQTTDTMYQAMLPNHANSGFDLHPYVDVIVDIVESKKNLKTGEVSIPRLDLSGQYICPPMADFQILGWDDAGETEHEDTEEEKDVGNGFQFDLDASVPAEEEIVRSIDPFNIDEEDENEENVMRHIQKPVEQLVDLRKVIMDTGLTTSSEYSILEKNRNVHWAGLAYWKVNNVNGALGGSKIVEACPQERGRKRKEIELHYDGNTSKAAQAKFTLSSRIQIRQQVADKDWHESLVTLPRDFHYDIAITTKLYLHELIFINPKNNDDVNTTHVSDDICAYDYDNENDTSNYCPNIPVTDYETDDRVRDEDGENGTSENFGTNLVAIPTLTNKVSIAYSVRPKRIDMRQLKKSIWNHLIEPNGTEIVDIQPMVQQETDNQIKTERSFSDVYKYLPNVLSKTNAESLSFPIAFVSLLHLANEKNLSLQSPPDMSDIVVAHN